MFALISWASRSHRLIPLQIVTLLCKQNLKGLRLMCVFLQICEEGSETQCVDG
jgi:hypothetical protein